MVWWLYIVCFLGLAEAGDVTLWYSTDLDTEPTVLVEQKGTEFHPSVERNGMADALNVWKIQWDGEGTLVHQVHIDHSAEGKLATVITGRVNDQELFLLNHTEAKTQQWTSTAGGLDQTRESEISHRQWSLLWFSLTGCLCVLLSWLKPLSSKDSRFNQLINSFEDRVNALPFILTTVMSLLFFVGVSCWMHRNVLGLDGIPAMYHDALGSYWLIGRSGTLESLDGFFDATTQFPQGTEYRALDSYTLWLSAKLFAFLESQSLYKLWAVLGPALSAWCANLLAREWGVKAPWSWLAGLVFGFSGLVQNALLEGQIYQTMLVGLPCLAISIRRFQTSNIVSWSWGMALVASFASCMFTSSYIGASAMLLLAGWFLGSKGWKDVRSIYVALGILPILWLQVDLMSSVDGLGVREALKVSIGSLSWDNFWGASPEMLRERHSIALGLSIVGVVLSMLSVVRIVQTAQLSKWGPIIGMGALSLLFALGPTWQLDPDTGWTFPVMEWVYSLPGISSIGFPIRLAQPFVLVVALLSAVSLQRLVQQTPLALLLFPMALFQLDSMGFAERQQVWSTEAPSLESIPDHAPIFTLYPQAYERNQGSDADIELYMQDCVAQVVHGHPITNHCISVDVHASQSKDVQQQLMDAILEHRLIWDILEPLGIEHLVIYPELFLPVDRERVRRSLERHSVRIESGTVPLQYWVYQRDEEAIEQPTLLEETNTFVPAEVTIDLWTSKDYASPILLLGEGLLTESKLSIEDQFIRHRFVVTTPKSTLPITLQSSEGVVFWDDILQVNPIEDHIVIREGEGQQMELPLVDSPYVSSPIRGVHGLLFGSGLLILGAAVVLGRRE